MAPTWAPHVEPVGRKMTCPALSARIKLGRLRPGAQPFLLDLSLEAAPGFTILFGPSGSGKSTLLDCVSGLLPPDEGRITVAGEALFDSLANINLSPQRRRVAYVFQTLSLFPHMTVTQNVAYGLRDLPSAERAARVAEALSAFHVDQLHSRRPEEISGGERQRVALARSLVTQPRVLLLDEPLSGLDADLKAAILDDLRTWNAARRIPILYVTHSRDEVDALGEHVIAMDHGRVVGAGTPMAVLDAPRRKRLAQAAGFENLLPGTVVDLREPDGVMRVRLRDSPCEIEVPLGYATAGAHVVVAIRAGDILLATAKPEGLSARNVLAGRILEMESRGTIVVARVHCGVEFVARVTPSAVRALGLVRGAQVWLVLKTHSCHLVDDSSTIAAGAG
ncbi:MAG TPA: molybdenum ABC transporter ATP-binding protein [Candidatus Acidoferrum sp.]|nr:molybdenum ABC transporter ATP-binding protein [Candidatus Acidoferrum sp.]